MEAIEIVFVLEPTLPDNQPTRPHPIGIGKWTCEALERTIPPTPPQNPVAPQSVRS